MKTTFKKMTLATLLVAAGTAGAIALHVSYDAPGSRADVPAHVLSKLKRGVKSQVYGKPAEALAFFVEQRLPEGAARLDPALYEAARDATRDRPWFSLAKNTELGGVEPKLLTELSDWEQLGPGNIGGRTRVLRFHPDNPDIIFAAGVAGGVWKTVDAGQNWQPLSDLAENLAVVSMVIDRTDPDRMWIGTGEGVFNGDAARGAGVFMSKDGGATWNQMPGTDTSDFHYVNDLVQSPNTADVLYAATRSGVMRLTGGDEVWTKVVDSGSGGIDVYGGCMDLDVRTDVQPNDVVFAACGTFGYNSAATELANSVIHRNVDANGGGDWETVLSPGADGTAGRSAIAVSPSDPSILYTVVTAGGGDDNYNALLGVWRSDDGGTTWEAKTQNTGTNDNDNLLLTNPIIAKFEECYGYPPGSNAFYNQGWYDLAINIDPVDPDRVWVGGIDLWRSDNQGADWGLASYWWLYPTEHAYVHADQHGIVFHPGYDGVGNRTLFVVNDGGIHVTHDALAAVGVNSSPGPENSICAAQNQPEIAWENLNNGYSITQFYHGTVYPDATTFMGGTQDNGTLRGSDQKGKNNWSEVYGGDGGYTAFDPRDPQIIYVETTNISMLKSVDGGLSFTGATNGIDDSGIFINPFTIDLRYPDRLWTSGRKMWRTDDGANSWTAASVALPETGPFGPGHFHSAHAIAPGAADLVIVGTNYGALYRNPSASVAGPATQWAPNLSGTQGRLRSGSVGMISFDPTQNDSDPDNRIAVAVFSAFNSELTFGGGLSAPHVMKTTDGGMTWTGIDGLPGSQIPNVPVHSVVIDPTTRDAQRMFVGTDIGVFVTTDGGQTWLRENAGGANTIVEWLSIQTNPATNTLELVAFTHGRSAYRTNFQPGDHIFANNYD